MPIGSISYDDTSRREDLADVVTNISPDATPLLSSWKSSTAANSMHEYLQDTLAAAAANAQVEAVAFTAVDPSQPTRLNNNTQIFGDFVTVSGTQMAINHGGMTDPMKYQISKQLKEHAKDKPISSMSFRNLAKSVKTKAFDGIARLVLPLACYVNTEERLAV